MHLNKKTVNADSDSGACKRANELRLTSGLRGGLVVCRQLYCMGGKKRVCHEIEDADEIGADSAREKHVTQLADGGIPLQVRSAKGRVAAR